MLVARITSTSAANQGGMLSCKVKHLLLHNIQANDFALKQQANISIDTSSEDNGM